MPDRSRLTIGKYQVESELGVGGFGRVYKAFDPGVGRPVAIKMLTALDSPELIERFRAEAYTTGNLHHPNIVTIYDFGVQEDSPYIVMEYLEGSDLRQLMGIGQPCSLLDKVRIMAQVGQALEYAHQKGVVHRDVKPSNIRVLPNGNVMVLDFGIARLVRENSTRLTQSGLLIGTIMYMAPEQFRGQDADALSDIFAYGEVFYEFLSGQHPFQAPEPVVVMAKVVGEQPAPLSQVAPGCPSALEQVVARTLEKDRERRYQSFGDLLLDLRAVQSDLQVETARARAEEMRRSLSSGNIVEAQAAIRGILELDPSNAEARRLRGQVEESIQRMSVQEQIAATLKAVDAQIERGTLNEAVASLESTRRLDPASPKVAARLQEIQRLQQERARPKQPLGPEPDRTVLIDRKSTDLPPTPEEAPDAPEQFTRFFGKPEPDEPAADFTRTFKSESNEPLNAYVTIVSCADSFRVGQSISIRSSAFTVGRVECDLSFPEDDTLSRQHAEIRWNGSGFSLQDLRATNGTYLNGRIVPPGQAEPLPLNAEIRLSSTTRLRFRCDISELPDFTGQVLADRYTLEKCLRAGRKSALYEGSDSRPVRKVAVKLLSPTLATYPGYLEQFEREAQTAAELDHPNICKIYEYGSARLVFGASKTKSVPYLCMQMLDGGSLADRLDAPEHVRPAAVADWLGVVSDALHDAHRKDVVHAGLKPTSIVFSAAGVAYVTDFAIATRPRGAVRGQPNLGAPEYLSPEQWEGLVAGPESDQYSLACLCYRVLTGVVPFENQIEPQTRSRNFERGPIAPDVRAVQQGRQPLLPSTSSVLTRALALRPPDRFPTISDFAQAFHRSLGENNKPDRKPRVFVSYRREADAGWAALFADKLSTHHGLDVFVDRQRVDSARQVPEKIGSAIRDSDFFVCLLSKSTLESAWVREEIRIADAAGKTMIPIVHEGFERPTEPRVPAWLKRFLPRSWLFPEYARRLMDAEEVRLFADYDDGAIEKLAKMILSTRRKA